MLVVGAIAGVIVGNDGFEGIFFSVRVLLVIGFFLRQVFLNLLPHPYCLRRGVRRRRRYSAAGNLHFPACLACLHFLEKLVVFDGVVDGGSGQ